MSSTWALVRFKKTGNVYMGHYNGTSDIMNPFICTPEECYEPETDCYSSLTYCRELAKGRSWKFPDEVTDLDEVEIYSDYGGGFYWSGTGSESIKMLNGPLDTWADSEDVNVTDGIPAWADEFWLNLRGRVPMHWKWRDNRNDVFGEASKA